MSSRALSLATVLLLIGFGAADAVLAQATNLEAGKAPSQLFAQTCNACHKSPRGLLKTVAPGSLPGFLRQHYTTSSDMAGVLASYLVSNGATDTRYQAKDGKDKKDAAKEKEAATNPAQSPEHQGRRSRSQEAAKPEGEGAALAPEGRQKRVARPSEEGAKDGAKPEGQATNEQSPEGRKAKRLSKRSKPETEEPPKTGTATAAPSGDKNVEPKPETAKVDSGHDESKPDSAKAAEKPAEVKPESAKLEPSGSEAPALRPDPVPAVTPAPPSAAAKQAEPAAPKPAEAAASKPAEPATSSSAEPAAEPPEPPPPATAAAPAPAESSGPPVPPISR